MTITIDSIFSNYDEGLVQRKRTDTVNNSGFSTSLITKKDIDHLLSGGVLELNDGKYSHYIKMK
jgi:hypothetical protein